MKSVKPGRGPSFMSGIACIGAAVVGVLWTVFSGSMGAPDEFTAFGVIFVLLAIASAVYNLVNATGKNSFSVFDVTDGHEEPDPLNDRFGAPAKQSGEGRPSAFCPYCGQKLDADYKFCPHCGKGLRHE